jgi:hypothetical protein
MAGDTLDGFGCKECGFATQEKKRVREHWFRAHQDKIDNPTEMQLSPNTIQKNTVAKQTRYIKIRGAPTSRLHSLR